MALLPLKLKSHTLSYHKQSRTLTQIRFIWTKQVGKVGEKNAVIKQIKTDTFLVCHLMYIVEIGCFVSCLFGSLSSYQLYILVHFLLCLWRKNITKKNDTPILFVEILNCFLLCVFVYGVSVSNHIRLWLLFVFPPPPTTILQYISLLLLYIFNLSSFICWFGEFSPNANVTFRYNCTFIYCLFIC